jgi:hypothetical protein
VNDDYIEPETEESEEDFDPYYDDHYDCGCCTCCGCDCDYRDEDYDDGEEETD